MYFPHAAVNGDTTRGKRVLVKKESILEKRIITSLRSCKYCKYKKSLAVYVFFAMTVNTRRPVVAGTVSMRCLTLREMPLLSRQHLQARAFRSLEIKDLVSILGGLGIPRFPP